MIVLPVPDPGHDVTWIVVGLALTTVGLFLLTAAWWTEANRNDDTVLALAGHDGDLADIRGDLAAIATYLGIEITEDEDMQDPATEPIPAQPATEPSDLPLQVQTALLAAQTEVVPVYNVSAEWDTAMAELRAKWDAEDAAA